MEAFCKDTIMDIRTANNEEDLIHVISGSLSRWRRERNSFNESGYIMNMIVSLRAIKTNDLPTDSVDNIKLATAIFRKLQAENRERIV